MKNLKKLLALLLVAALCVCLLAACASDKKADEPQPEQPGTEEPGTEEPGTEEPGTEEPTETPDEPEEIVEITMYGLSNSAPEARVAAVQDAINEIIEPKIGVHVNMKFFDFGNYNTQLNLAISGGETVDLANFDPLPGGPLSTLVANTQAMDIKDMLNEYGPDIVAAIEPYLGAYTYGDGIYGLPALRQKASNLGLAVNAGMAEELGVVDALENAETWADIEAIYDVVTENLSGVFANGNSRYIMTSSYFILDSEKIDATPFDSLGDQMFLVYGTEDGKASNLYENEDYLNELRMFAEWYKAGYIYPDTPYNTDISGNDLLKNKMTFSQFSAGEVGGEATMESMVGFDVILRPIAQGNLTTTVMTVWGNFVPSTAKEPEAAIKFLNELYVNEDLMNLIDNGINGEDYVVNDAGEACYPEGVDPAAVYHYSDWMIGNSFLVLPWEGSGSDFREVAKADLANSVASPYMGFTLDTSNISNLVGGISSVSSEYRGVLEGGLYTDDICQEYMDKLASADFQSYLDEIQTQLDAWLNQ